MKLIYNSKKEEIACCFFRTTVSKPNIKVLLQITERCNMKCKHCFVSSLAEGRDLSFETIKNVILPKLKEANVTRVTLTGGEPMVHRNIMDIIKLFSENKIHVTLCTNAVGLNKLKIIEISKLNDVYVNVSLDGFSSASHGNFRGNDSDIIFNRIIDNIKLLSKYNLLNGIMTSPNKYSSIQEYIDICKFAKELNANYVLFNPLSNFGRGQYTQNLGYTKEELIELRKCIEKENFENEKFQVVFIRIPKDNSNYELSECNCEIPYIFTNGDVAVCPYLVFTCQKENQNMQQEIKSLKTRNQNLTQENNNLNSYLKAILEALKHFFRKLLQIGNDKTKENTASEIKDYYNNQDFDMYDVKDISKGTTKEDELFDYAKVPSYLKSSKKCNKEKNKDNFELSL